MMTKIINFYTIFIRTILLERLLSKPNGKKEVSITIIRNRLLLDLQKN